MVVWSVARRLTLLLPLTLGVALVPAAQASGPAPDSLDATALTQLEAEATAARVADQCLLYVRVANGLTELAGRQLAEGHGVEAADTVRRLDALTDKIHIALNARPRHLQDAEVLLHNSSRRLADILRVTSDNSTNDLHTAIKHLNAVHAEMLAEIFRH